jgi:hypothetical protein
MAVITFKARLARSLSGDCARGKPYNRAPDMPVSVSAIANVGQTPTGSMRKGNLILRNSDCGADLSDREIAEGKPAIC